MYWAIMGEVIEERIRWIISKLDVKFITIRDLVRIWKGRTDVDDAIC